MTTAAKSTPPLEPNHDADATTTDSGGGPAAPIILSDRPPRAVLTRQQARDRIKAAGKGEDPDKVAPLDPQKAVHSAEPAEAPKPKREKKREKAPVEAKKSTPPPAAKSAPPPAAPAAPKAKAEPAAPKAPPTAPEPPKAPAAPPPPEAHREKAELAKRARAVDRDAKRVEARATQLQQAEQHVNELLQKFDPSDPDKFMENLDAHLRSAGKDMSAAVRAWAQKKMGKAPAATPGQPPPPAAPAAPPPGEDPRDRRLAELERAEAKRRADAAKAHWQGHFKGELTTTPPDPTTHPTLAALDEDYLAEVMTMTAAQVMRSHNIRLDTLQLYDMIEEAEAEELAVLQKKRKKQPATTGASPEREPAGTQTQKHEPSKANQPIDVSSRARAGSTVAKPQGKIDRDKIRAVHRGHA